MTFETKLSSALEAEPYQTGENTLAWGGRIADIITAILGQIDLPPKETVVALVRAGVQRIFDNTNIPNVPQPIEVMIEQLVMTAILGIVERNYDRLARE